MRGTHLRTFCFLNLQGIPKRRQSQFNATARFTPFVAIQRLSKGKIPNGSDLTKIEGDSLFAIVGEIVAVRYLRVNEFVLGQISRSVNYQAHS
jgi:hypothetical protein